MAILYLRAVLLLVGLFILNQSSDALDYSVIGCYLDNPSARDLPWDYIESSSAQTRQICVDHCRKDGFRYAGVQNGCECYCGNTYGSYSTSLLCNSACTGNKYQICGGIGANTILDTNPTLCNCATLQSSLDFDNKQIASLQTQVTSLLTQIASLQPKCASGPCQNCGSCCETSSGPLCTCLPGFKGTYCETIASFSIHTLSGKYIGLPGGNTVKLQATTLGGDFTYLTPCFAPPALTDGCSCVSIASTAFPNHYLRHYNFIIQMDPPNGGLFVNDASFMIRPGKFQANYVAFESTNYPGYYIQSKDSDGTLRVAQFGDPTLNPNFELFYI